MKDLLCLLVGMNMMIIILFIYVMSKINSLQSRVDAHEKMFFLHNKSGMETIKILTLLKDAIFETGKADDKSDVKQG